MQLQFGQSKTFNTFLLEWSVDNLTGFIKIGKTFWVPSGHDTHEFCNGTLMQVKISAFYDKIQK